MHKFVLACLSLFLCTFAVLSFAAGPDAPKEVSVGEATAPVPVSNPSPVALTPDEARRALEVLNDPKRRAQIEVTLRAVAAAGALSAQPASAAVPASAAAAPAHGASGALPAALAAGGLASQVSHQAAHAAHEVGDSVRRSTSALLDWQSVSAWWGYETANPDGRAQLHRLGLTILTTLLPAWLVAAVVSRVLRKRLASVAAGRLSAGAHGGEWRRVESAGRRTGLAAFKPLDAAARNARNAARAGHNWSLLQRLPGAILHTGLAAVPLVLFVVLAIAAMSMVTDEGTPEARVLETLIEVYAISRAIALAGDFLLAPSAPRLRVLQLRDAWAAFAHRWLVRLVAVLGTGAALAFVPLPLGLAPEAHLAIVKAVSFAGHVMISIVIMQIRRPAAKRIRAYCRRWRALSIAGNWLADVWAGVAVFFVMALWFVWALDVQNGYRVLLHHGGTSVAILIGARLVAIVTFGVLGRILKPKEAETDSLAMQHAQRYYAFLRRAVSAVIVVVTANILLSVWGFDAWQALMASSIGPRLVSALTTIAVAAFVAFAVWETVNLAIERRLRRWTEMGDLVRAARLRTLLPMLRTTLLVAIALVVGLTGLSELGVNIAPLLAGASIFGVALGFGSQTLVKDFITGMFLLMENTMQVGDWVTLASVSGTVEYLSIRTVRLRGADGSLYTVPFSSVSTVNNTNRGLGNAAVKVGIAYGQDVDLAVATLKEIGAALREDEQFKDGILSDFSYWGVDQVDGAMVVLAGQMQCRDTARWSVQREFNRRIAELFRTRGIAIANPLRNVLVASGVPGQTAAQGAEAVQGASPHKA